MTRRGTFATLIAIAILRMRLEAPSRQMDRSEDNLRRETPRRRQRQFQGSASFLSRFSDGCRFRKAAEKPLEARTENSSQWRTVLSSLHAYFNVCRIPTRRRSYSTHRKSIWSFKNDI
jgi:hypothetical protein